jgi:hypothetical protein
VVGGTSGLGAAVRGPGLAGGGIDGFDSTDLPGMAGMRLEGLGIGPLFGRISRVDEARPTAAGIGASGSDFTSTTTVCGGCGVDEAGPLVGGI